MSNPACQVEVIQSDFWQTNTGIITAPDGTVVLVDPGVLPDEMTAIASRVGQGRVIAGIATHEDWDHVLWDAGFGTDIPRWAHPITARILAEHREAMLTSLRNAETDLGVAWDHDLIGRVTPVADRILTPGESFAISLIPTPGHTEGHTSLWLEREHVLFAGDMLSDIDIPMLADLPDVARTYLGSLDTLSGYVAQADVVIPGHGARCDRDEAMRRLDLDRRYLNDLIGRAPAVNDDPRMKRDANRDAHRDNLRFAGS